MKQEYLGGNTLDLAEIIVDYRKRGKKKVEMKGITKQTSKSAIMQSAAGDWLRFLFQYLILAQAIGVLVMLIMYAAHIQPNFMNYIINNMNWFFPFYILGPGFIITYGMSVFHLNRKFDENMKRFFALKTVKKSRYKTAIFSGFKSKTFVIHDFDNVVVDYEATKDVSKQLNKVWIKEECASSRYESQSDVNDLKVKDSKIWNVYFFFSRIPKSGRLYVKWI